MQVPTEGDEYAKMMEHLIKVQECASMLAHLSNNYGPKGRSRAIGWLAVEQQMKLIQATVTKLAIGKLQ